MVSSNAGDGTTRATTEGVLVAVCTFRRPAMLAELLRALLVQVVDGARLLVVDNDERESARPVVGSFPGVEYIVESLPGVASARNRALEERLPHEAIAFIDDDEIPDPVWLPRLRDSLRVTGADAVGGPVVTVYAADVPRWVRRLGIHERAERPEGPTGHLATNNVIIAPSAFEKMDSPKFSLEFNATGGEDTEFFERLIAVGGRTHWCRGATVEEEVNADRATIRWIFTRGVQTGTTTARLALRSNSRWLIASKGIAQIGRGVLLVLVSLGAWRSLLRLGILDLSNGVGLLVGVSGRITNYYGDM